MPAYRFTTHSEATKFLCEYYVDMRGYKLFEPKLAGGVFAVACIHDDLLLTVLDDKTIQKSSGRVRDGGLFTETDFNMSLSDLSTIKPSVAADA